MVLGAVGDAMGFKNGEWEFTYDGAAIHQAVAARGGVAKLNITEKNFIVSDDTILHIATANGLVSDWPDQETLFKNIAKEYIQADSNEMAGRSPGPTTMGSIARLRPEKPQGYRIPFSRSGGGCGAAMRAAPIGLLFSRPDQLRKLVEVSIEAGRMTHNHPTGYLGSLATALFVSYGIQDKPPREWGAGLMKTLGNAWEYILKVGIDVEENKTHWDYFENAWNKYLELRGIQDGKSDPVFPERYGVKERDEFYQSVSWNGWGGASGHDAPMIAYDAILGAGDSWEELCLRAVLHGGDSDSTGIIAGSAWGALHGFKNVPEANYSEVEFHDSLVKLARKLCAKK